MQAKLAIGILLAAVCGFHALGCGPGTKPPAPANASTQPAVKQVPESPGLKIVRVADQAMKIDGNQYIMIAVWGQQASRWGYDSWILQFRQPCFLVWLPQWARREADLTRGGVTLHWIAPDNGRIEFQYGMIFQDAALGPQRIKEIMANWPVHRLEADKMPVIPATSAQEMLDAIEALPLTIERPERNRD